MCWASRQEEARGEVRLPAGGIQVRRAAARGSWPSAGTARCALLAGADSIRDVIAFPKAGGGRDPLTGAPAPISDEQRAETGVDYDPEEDED